MEKRRLSLNRSGGAKNYNNPLKGGPYSAHPVHYNMIENIHLDLDAMDNEIDKALNSTSTKVRQVTHNFTVLQSIYFNTDTRKWVLAQADDKDTIGTHIVVEVIDKDYFVAGLSGIFEVRNTLDLGYWFTSDTVAGELVDTAPDINNPMIQVIDSNSIRVLDIGIVDNLDSIPANNVIVTNAVTPDYTAPEVGDTMQNITNKVAGLQGGKVTESNKLYRQTISHDYPNSSDIYPVVSFCIDRQSTEVVDGTARGNGFPDGGFKEIFEVKGVKLNVSVVDDFTREDGDEYMTYEDIIQLQEDGHELMTHIRADDSSVGTPINYTESEALAALLAQKTIHKTRGYNTQTANWFRGQSTYAFQNAVKKVYKGVHGGSGFTISNTNYILGVPQNPYALKRVELDPGRYNDWVEAIDLAIESKQYIQLFGHAYTNEWYTTKYDDDGNVDPAGDYVWQKIGRIIDYVQSKENYGTADGVRILTCSEALDVHGASIDFGVGRYRENNLPFFRVGKNGRVSSDKLDKVILTDTLTLINSIPDQTMALPSGLTAVGQGAGVGAIGAYHVAIGLNAGKSTVGNNVVSIGLNANNNASDAHVGIGSEAGSNSTTQASVMIGGMAGYYASGFGMVTIGKFAGRNATSTTSVMVGYAAGDTSRGERQCLFGYEAGSGNTGKQLMAFGYRAGKSNSEDYLLVIQQQINANPLIKGYFDSRHLIFGAPTTAIADAKMGNSSVSFYIDESAGSEKLKFKVKLSDGTVKIGEINIV